MKFDNILILGAKSDIGIALAHEFAKEGSKITLAGRNISEIDRERKNIVKKYAIEVDLCEFDALNLSEHSKFINSLKVFPDIVVSTIGLMGNQKENETDLKKTVNELRCNYEGPVSIFLIFANEFEKRNKGGTLVGFSSVAGERGRSKNYIYGSAKAGFTAFLSGLRNRLSSKGIHVLTVLPGYVFTKMTKNLNLPKFLTAQPREVARDIVVAVKKRKTKNRKTKRRNRGHFFHLM